MNYYNVQNLGDLIREFIKQHKGPDFLDEMRIIESWKSVVGPFIASHTLDLSIKNNVMFVRVDSDALRMELSYSKSVLMNQLNGIVGREVVKEIVFN